MTLTQLKYITAVDTHRHFGRAADDCNISQPTLSMQIRKLENELDIQIFDRSRKPVVPTNVGRQVIVQAREVLRESQRIPDLISELSSEMAGTLRIGIIPTLAPYLLPHVTPRFSEQYPGVELVIEELITEQILEELHRDTLDAGLVATDMSKNDVHQRSLFEEPFVAYVSPDHRFTNETLVESSELSLDDLWLLKEGHCFRDQVLQVCGEESQACGATRSILFESGSLETLRHTVDSVGGMTLLPYLATLYLSDEQLEQHVKPFRSPTPRREISIVYRREYLKKHLIDSYVDVILDRLPPELLEAG
jgi:LysR family hydrogen peroxide-inducible transcriptional activator